MTVFVDTNVLLYAINLDGKSHAKRDISVKILGTERCAFSHQVFNEFMGQATHHRHSGRLTLGDAAALVASWRRHVVQSLDDMVFDAAIEVARHTNYTWWDCLIIAAARITGCDTLATEDMQHGRVIDGVRIVNPFRDAG